MIRTFANSAVLVVFAGVLIGSAACGSSSDAETGGSGGAAGTGGNRGEPPVEVRSREVQITWDSWRVNNASSVEVATPFTDNLELAGWGFVTYYQFSDPSDPTSEVVTEVAEFVEVRESLEFTTDAGDLPNPVWALNRTLVTYTEYCDLGDPLLALDLYEVDQDLDDFEDELEAKSLEVASVLAGAAAGAAVGSAFPLIGNFVGGVIGGASVLVAAWFEQWLNTDDSLGRTFRSGTDIYLEDGQNGFRLDGKSDSASVLSFTKTILSGSCEE